MNYLQLISDDIKKYVLGIYLYPIDIYRNIEFFSDDILTYRIRNIITNKLKFIFKNKYYDLLSILNNKNAFISGSFPLQCILNEDWSSDIDIFYIDNNDNDLLLKEFENILTDEELDLSNQVDELKYMYLNNLPIMDIKSYHKIHISEYKKIEVSIDIQFIKIDPNYFKDNINNDNFDKLITHYLDNEFDFNVCTNYFYIKNNNYCISLNNLNNIFNKEITLKRNINLYTILKRVDKYKERGFKFDINVRDEIWDGSRYNNQRYLILNTKNTVQKTLTYLNEGIYKYYTKIFDLSNRIVNYFHSPLEKLIKDELIIDETKTDNYVKKKVICIM